MTLTYCHRCLRPDLWYLFGLFVIFVYLTHAYAGETRDLGPYYYLGCYSARTDLLQDTGYHARHAQKCIEFCEKLNIRYAILSGDNCFCDNMAIDSEKLDSQFCNNRCTEDKSQYCGGTGAHSYYATLSTGPPGNVRIANSSENSILMAWTTTRQDERVTGFMIKAVVVHSYTNYPFFSQPQFIVQSTEDRFEMTDLFPATTYNITISAMCGKYVCGIHNLVGVTEIGIPDPAPVEPTILNRTNQSIFIEIDPYVNNNGPVTSYRVIVQRVDDSITQLFDEELLVGFERAQEDGLSYYIAAELPYQNGTQRLHVGDNRTYGGYWNAPLHKDDHIHVSLGVVSTLNGITKARYAMSSHKQDEPEEFQYADFEPGRPSAIALGVVCVVFGIILLLSIIIYLYLKRETARLERLPSDTHELTTQGPMIEENNAFVNDDGSRTTFREKLNEIVTTMGNSQKLPRNAIRMNVDDIIADGKFGEVITGKFYTSTEAYDCQIHVLSDDMDHEAQTHFLRDFENLVTIMPDDKFQHFFGITASPDWFYLLFENCQTTLKRRLIESRLPSNSPSPNFTSLTEECVLQWIYEVVTVMEYLEENRIYHKHLCCYSVYVTDANKVKVSLFGPIPYVEDNKKVDISRWSAPEVLRFQNYSSKSDVWSFACFAWECCTLGATPYANITSQDLLPRIKNGIRPDQPAFVFRDIYQLFLNCWQLEPSDRPEFEDVAFSVRQILTSPSHALSFVRNDQTVLPNYLPLLEVHN